MASSPYTICVYCGSRDGKADRYKQEAQSLGHAFATRGWRLVFGAGSIGLMGALSRAVLEKEGEAIGVIPHHLDHVEITQTGLTKTIKTETMHERKKIMFDWSDAFVVLPGGLGTLDEMFEMITWAQLRLHDRPIYVLDIDGFWQPLQDLLAHLTREGFVDADTVQKLVFVPTSEMLLQSLSEQVSARTSAAAERPDLF